MRRLISTLLLVFLWVTAEAQMHDVSVQLKWWHQFQFAGYYAALKEGYYTRAGLRATLIAGE
jgi:ABC-type nitrate/sulfonate/bicarbonate transport system substrate-binding protein